MGQEIDLLKNYPKSNRDVSGRGDEKTDEDREIARRFDKEFFDGDRRYGYGGYNYNEKFWSNVVPDFRSKYNLSQDSSILDVGCGKGFMLYDFKRLIPGINVRGIDISQYAIENSLLEIKDNLDIGCASIYL